MVYASLHQDTRTAKQKTPVASLIVFAFAGAVEAIMKPVELQLTHPWAIARGLAADGRGGSRTCRVVVFELREADGRRGLGEASPSRRYGEDIETVQEYLQRIDPQRLSAEDIGASMAYLDTIAPGNHAAKGAVNIALLDLAAGRARQPLCDHLELGFREGRHITSFSIGIDAPETIRAKVLAAEPYPILKLKLGGPHDRENVSALRAVAPHKPIRVDANEGWQTKENALRQIEWLAEAAQPIEFVEQPLPSELDPKDHAWLKARSPIPVMADESYVDLRDVTRCADLFHAVNVKLIKTGGVTGAVQALRAARQAGLKTMIGCMIETSILISAAAHLAELSDYLDLDGNLLITNDPFMGATARHGAVSFGHAPEAYGLRVRETVI